jgi:hypothetical protein
MHVLTLTSRMNTSIYIVPGIQLLPQIVNIWVNALSSRKMLEGISSQVCIFSGRYSF